MTNTLYTQALALHHALLVAHWAARGAGQVARAARLYNLAKRARDRMERRRG